MAYALTLYEKETIINYNEAESSANIYTHNVALRNKLLKLICVLSAKGWT